MAVPRRDEEQEVVAIDGQTLHGSGDDRAGRHPLHLVRAWATTNRLVLGQQACAEKSNEITAIPQLLKLIDIAGAIVTIDAMGCQIEIAAAILERGADYVLAVKDNQPKLHTEIRETFEPALEQATSGQPPAFLEQVERQQKRRRDEERHDDMLSRPQADSTLGRWRVAQTIGMVVRRRTIRCGEQIEVHYDLSSLPLGMKRFARAARSHWGIENRWH